MDQALDVKEADNLGDNKHNSHQFICPFCAGKVLRILYFIQPI